MIMVMGATGNVGRPLVDLLVGAGAEVRAGDVVLGAYPGFAEAPLDVRDLAAGDCSEWVAVHAAAFEG